MEKIQIFDPNDPPRFWITRASRNQYIEAKIIEKNPDFYLVQETKDGFCITVRIDRKRNNK